MNTATHAFSLFTVRRARRTPTEIDPADMGTCFGLEMSLDDEPRTEHTVAPRPAAPAWWQRLGGVGPAGG